MNDQVIGLAACNAWARAKHFGCPSVIPSVCYPGIRVGADYDYDYDYGYQKKPDYDYDYDYMCLIMIIMHTISHVAIQPVSLHCNWLIAPNKH